MPDKRTKRVYHFCDEEFGLVNLKNSRLKVATVLELNDPFELSCYKMPDREQRHAARALKKDFASRFGFICFSEDYQSPLQWGHYANSHRGICLGFDIPIEKLHSVIYIKSMMEFDRELYLGLSSDERIEWMGKLIRTKHSQWGYEKESRRLVTLSESIKEVIGGKQMFFSPLSELGELQEVIVGCNSTISRSRLQEALGDRKDVVRTFKVRPAFNTFTMIPNANESLWK